MSGEEEERERAGLEFFESVKKKGMKQCREEKKNSKANRTKGKAEFSYLMYALTILNKLYKV